jgi:hypothetical protein
MNGSDAAAGSLLLYIFICGILIGIFALVCWASNREDSQHSLKRNPPGNVSGGVRRVVGVGRREGRFGQSPRWPGDQPEQGRGVNP